MTNETIDSLRLEAASRLNQADRGRLGQFMTPSSIADFMAGMFSSKPVDSLLDCGAGIGSLTLAVVNRLGNPGLIEAWEIDPLLRSYLHANLEATGACFTIHGSDFLSDSVVNICTGQGTRFSNVILNPPYKKIGTESMARLLMRKIGIETVNLYSAFLASAIQLTKADGEIVAIIPRSFCNGPYYKPFRTFLLDACSLDWIHVFDSRSKAFGDDDVLQENVILKLVKGKAQGRVKVSWSHDHSFADLRAKKVLFAEIVKPTDNERFIHVPTGTEAVVDAGLFSHSLEELSLSVSTGPVVDFRLKHHWLSQPSEGAIPLIYPHHFSDGHLTYPKTHKKPNALNDAREVRKWLMPTGWYVLVKRFSSKEERRRVVAYVFKPDDLPCESVGFENHWNVFHVARQGIDPVLAKGLAAFLNSTVLDEYFRVFSGHTQVNATDLRNMRYPSLEALRKIGRTVRPSMSQTEVDGIVERRRGSRTAKN